MVLYVWSQFNHCHLWEDLHKHFTLLWLYHKFSLTNKLGCGGNGRHLPHILTEIDPCDLGLSKTPLFSHLLLCCLANNSILREQWGVKVRMKCIQLYMTVKYFFLWNDFWRFWNWGLSPFHLPSFVKVVLKLTCPPGNMSINHKPLPKWLSRNWESAASSLSSWLRLDRATHPPAGHPWWSFECAEACSLVTPAQSENYPPVTTPFPHALHTPPTSNCHAALFIILWIPGTTCLGKLFWDLFFLSSGLTALQINPLFAADLCVSVFGLQCVWQDKSSLVTDEVSQPRGK